MPFYPIQLIVFVSGRKEERGKETRIFSNIYLITNRSKWKHKQNNLYRAIENYINNIVISKHILQHLWMRGNKKKLIHVPRTIEITSFYMRV